MASPSIHNVIKQNMYNAHSIVFIYIYGQTAHVLWDGKVVGIIILSIQRCF